MFLAKRNYMSCFDVPWAPGDADGLRIHLLAPNCFTCLTTLQCSSQALRQDAQTTHTTGRCSNADEMLQRSSRSHSQPGSCCKPLLICASPRVALQPRIVLFAGSKSSALCVQSDLARWIQVSSCNVVVLLAAVAGISSLPAPGNICCLCRVGYWWRSGRGYVQPVSRHECRL